MFAEDQGRLQTLGKSAGSALRIHEHFQAHPLSTIQRAHEALGLSHPAVAASIGKLVQQGLLREVTGRRRDRVFAYDRYLALLSEGTEPLRR